MSALWATCLFGEFTFTRTGEWCLSFCVHSQTTELRKSGGGRVTDEFFVAQCHQKTPEGINNSANLHIFSIPTLYVSTQRGNILLSFQHESQLLSGTWMDEEITDIRVRDWVILIMTDCNLIFSSTYIIIIIYVICRRPMSPSKPTPPTPKKMVCDVLCILTYNFCFWHWFSFVTLFFLNDFLQFILVPFIHGI